MGMQLAFWHFDINSKEPGQSYFVYRGSSSLFSLLLVHNGVRTLTWEASKMWPYIISAKYPMYQQLYQIHVVYSRY